MADDVSIVIGATLGNLTSGLASAKSAITDFAGAVAGAFAITEIDDFIEKMAKLGTTTEGTAAQLGAPVKQVQEFGAMAVASGTSAESFTNMMNRLAVGMERSQVATSQQAAAAKALGINFKEFGAASPETKIYMLADAMHSFADGTTKTADVLMLAGRGAAQNIGFFDQGSTAIKAWQKAMEDAGAVVSGEVIESLANLDRNLVLMNSTWTAFGETVVAKLSPGVTALVTAFTSLATALTKSATEGGVVSVVLSGISYWMEALAIITTGFSAAWQATWDAIKLFAYSIGDVLQALGRLMKDVFTLHWSDVSAAWDDLKANIAANVKATAADMVAIYQKAKDDINKIMSGVGLAPPGGGAAGTGQAPGANLAAAQAAKNALKIADDMYAELKIKEDAAVKTYQITEADRTEVLKAALVTRMNAEIAAGENRSVAEAKYNKDLAELDAQTTEKIIADWKKAADQFASDFSSALDQVLSKQKSFGAAMTEMFGKMIEQMIADVIKLIAEYVILNAAIGAGLGGPTAKPVTIAGLAGSAFPLLGGLLGGGGATGGAQTAATTANTAAVTALTAAVTGHVAATAAQTTATAGQTVATAGQTVATAGQTTATAGQTAATTLSAATQEESVAQQIGAWVANTTATAANTIATWAKALSPFAEGAWNVGSVHGFPSYQGGSLSTGGGLAILHAGEMVIPSGPAQSIRDNSGSGSGLGGGGFGGGQNVSFSINAIDARSIANMFMSNKSILNAVLTQIARTNPGAITSFAQSRGA